jgi:RNA polymerase sigma-70 factor (ECF subfamily)
MTTLEVTPANPQETLPGFTPTEWPPESALPTAPELTEKDQRNTQLNTLAAQAQQGDTAAFGTLYKETSGDLERFLAGRTDRETARDLLQTTFLKAFEKLDTFKGGNVKSWLYTIAARTHLDSTRQDKRRTTFDAEDLLRDRPDPINAEAVVVSRALARELFTRSGLSEDQKQAIWLARVRDLPFHDIAKEQGAAEVTVRTRIHRGENLIRKHYPAA